MRRSGIVITLFLCASVLVAQEKKQAANVPAKPESTTAEAFSVEDSIRTLLAVVARDTGNVYAYYDLGMLYYLHQQRYDKALGAWEKVAQLTPDDGKMHFQLAWIYYHRFNNLSKAETEALEAIAAGKKGKMETKYWYALSHWVLATVYEEKGDSLNAQKARKEWQELAQQAPQSDNSLGKLNDEIETVKTELQPTKKKQKKNAEAQKTKTKTKK